MNGIPPTFREMLFTMFCLVEILHYTARGRRILCLSMQQSQFPTSYLIQVSLSAIPGNIPETKKNSF